MDEYSFFLCVSMAGERILFERVEGSALRRGRHSHIYIRYYNIIILTLQDKKYQNMIGYVGKETYTDNDNTHIFSVCWHMLIRHTKILRSSDTFPQYPLPHNCCNLNVKMLI